MKRVVSLFTVALVLIVLSGCASRRPPVETVRVPPRIDLKAHETIGVVQFKSPSRSELGKLTTQHFTDAARRDQGLVRMVGVGTKWEALRSVGQEDWNAETFRALGRKHGVQTLFTGTLTISDVRPDVKLSSVFRSGSVTAEVDAMLIVEMIEAETGASLWNTSASATRQIGNISVFGTDFAFDADDPEKAYGSLVQALVNQVTQDFQATWVPR